MEDELLGRQSAVAEARALYRMIGNGRNTVESFRELIAVPAKIEAVLLAYARGFPEEAYFVDRAYGPDASSSVRCQTRHRHRKGSLNSPWPLEGEHS